MILTLTTVENYRESYANKNTSLYFVALDMNYRPDPSMYTTLRIGVTVEATFSLYTPPINSDCSNITGISMDYAQIFKKV